MVEIFVPDLPEFQPLVIGARRQAACRAEGPRLGYWRISAPHEILLERKVLGLGPALWNSALTGGFQGTIVEYGRDRMCLRSEG